MGYKMHPSPAASTLFKALGSEESSAAMDVEAGDQAEHSPAADRPFGYDIGIKRKRNTQLLRQMLVDAGMGDLAKNINIRQHGGYQPHHERDDGEY